MIDPQSDVLTIDRLHNHLARFKPHEMENATSLDVAFFESARVIQLLAFEFEAQIVNPLACFRHAHVFQSGDFVGGPEMEDHHFVPILLPRVIQPA